MVFKPLESYLKSLANPKPQFRSTLQPARPAQPRHVGVRLVTLSARRASQGNGMSIRLYRA